MSPGFHEQECPILSSMRPMDIDLERFAQHLFEPESYFEILLRGHLWMENLINRILEIQVVNEGALDLDRIGFRQKVDIAQAFGFISQNDGYALKALNRLRNRLAHNLMAEPSGSEIRDLVNTLTGAVKAGYDAALHDPETIKQTDKCADLRYWIFCYAMELDYLYACTKYQKINHVKLAQVYAFRYASKLDGKEVSEEEARSRFNLEPPPVPDKVWGTLDGQSYRRRQGIQVDD